MARAVVQAGPAGTDAQRVGNGLALLVHIGGIPISSGQLRVCLIIPIGKPQRRVASSLLQHTLEIPQEHPMPREELYCTVLTPAPRCSFVGIGCDPGLNATHSRPNNRTCAVTPEMVVHIGPIDPAAAKVGAAAGCTVPVHHVRDAASQ